MVIRVGCFDGGPSGSPVRASRSGPLPARSPSPGPTRRAFQASADIVRHPGRRPRRPSRGGPRRAQVVRRRGEQGPSIGRECQVVDPAPVRATGARPGGGRRIPDLDVPFRPGADEHAPVGLKATRGPPARCGNRATGRDDLRPPRGQVEPDRVIEVDRSWRGHLQGRGPSRAGPARSPPGSAACQAAVEGQARGESL